MVKMINNFLKRLVVFTLIIILCTTGVSLLPSVTACPVGMVSCWKLDETTAGPVVDSFGSNDGTNNGATINQPGLVGTSYYFDGNAYVQVPDDVSLHLSSFTVMAWAKAEGNFGEWRSILTKDQPGQSEFWFGYASNNKLDFKFNGQSGLNIDGPSQQVITDTGWHFVVGVYDGSTIMVYVDGALDGSKPYGPMTVGTGTVNMGITLAWGDNCFLGVLDEVAIFNYALTSPEIMSYYHMGLEGRSYCTEPPVADADGPYTSDCGKSIIFDGSGSYDPDGVIVSYQWDFGDGKTGSGVNPAHTYDTSGVYTVTLLVTDDDGLTDTDVTTADISCPCNNLAVNKTVWDGSHWVDDIRVINGTLLKFKIHLTNDGYCPLNGIIITDYLSPPQLQYRNSSIAPVSSSAHQVIWTTSLDPGASTDIIYYAWTVHVCYGLNTVYITDSNGIVIGSDVSHVKVLASGDDPEIEITKQAWDGNTWSDHVNGTVNDKLTFKITVISTALVAAHNLIVTDVLPSLITYNNDASVTPDSISSDTVIWKLGTMNPGDIKEITYTATVVKVGTDSNKANVTSSEGHYSEDSVLLEISTPTVNLIYPQGGETLKGIATIQWSASDSKDGNNLPIYIYFKDVDSALWSAFTGNPYLNSGMLTWDTTSLPDGSYELQITAQDSNNIIGRATSNQFQIKNHEQPPHQNLAPNKPSTPSGITNSKKKVDHIYLTSTTDPEGDQVYYLWNWGDGSTSGWLGPYNSGVAVSSNHKWTIKGAYSIKVKAKDIYGKESSWSDPLPITMPYSFNNPILQFLELLFERFPHSFPILRHLLGY
jgi:uncharacterized repeat protein (TIGR01451 family)